jgi:hypothetical protein
LADLACSSRRNWSDRVTMHTYSAETIPASGSGAADVVPGAGIEPARPFSLGILSPLCLPVSPPGQSRIVAEKSGGGGRNRTGVHGFAGRCMTTLPPRRGLGAKRESPWRLSLKKSGAGKESRTPDLNLGKVALYQLSYSRVTGVSIIRPSDAPAQPAPTASGSARRR